MGETQERERVLVHFSRRFCHCNPQTPSSEGQSREGGDDDDIDGNDKLYCVEKKKKGTAAVQNKYEWMLHTSLLRIYTVLM